ncbi:TonB-dependent siderophore receptor [Flavobacterium sp. ABG]|uniref:TonB-dependent siderophore receptor n=1 Tax=Flavobacterium sp. ABG TaxID=1423322 RepID=UPI00064AC67E|nr:TonB-dependent siderophore receptor [Flavobacterium sp. ABG]KLT70197.1 TonB-dependent receptor [Flavobacterium sp. ABG]
MKYILLFGLSILSLTSYGQQYTNNDSGSSINDTVKKRKGEELKSVIITTNREPKPVTAVRSGLKPMDNPQSIQVIGSEVIEQQQAIRLSDVIKNANGVYVSSARGGAQESFFSRGYDMSANNMFKNGFRYNSGSIPDVSGLEKVEFLKGGSALLFGNVAPGGILNLVTKTPLFKAGGEISMQMGSYAFYKPSFDFYGPLSKSVAFRINGSYENSESFRDVVKNERLYINPSLLFVINPKTQITVQGDYLTADWTPDFGTGIIGKEILDLPRNAFYGSLWSNGTTKSASASVLLNHDFNKNWKLNFNSSFQSYDRAQLSTAQLSGLETYATPGDWNRGLSKTKNLEQILGDQLSLQGNFYTGSVKHQLYTGVDWENSFATAYTYTFDEKYVQTGTKNGLPVYGPTLYDTINLFTFDPNTQRKDIPTTDRATAISKTDTNRFGVYFQDLVSITEKFKVLAGLRWSWQETEVSTYSEILNAAKTAQVVAPENATAVVAPKKLDNAFSPKVGLIYQPIKEISLFGSYSSSFTPNTGTTVDSKPIAPSIIDQYETGIKMDFLQGMLTTNVTVYQITNSNLAQTAEFDANGALNVNSQLKVLGGGTRSKGVEIDVTATPLEGLNIVAGYSYNDMRYTNTSGTNGSFVEGDRVARTPQTTANLSFFYKLNDGMFKGLSFGAIGNYIGNRLGGWNDDYLWTENKTPVTNPKTYKITIRDRDIPLEAYTTIDVSAGYEWRKFSILCKLSNVTNELNYTVHENYSVNPIAPRQIMTSLKYKF